MSDLFFDFQGVITKNHGTAHNEFYECVKDYISYEEIDKRYELARIGKINFEEFSEGIPKEKIDDFEGKVELREGIEKILEKLSKEHNLYLVSNHIDGLFESEFSLLKKDYFKKQFLSYKIGISKTEDKFYDLIIKETNCNPKKSYFIDDSKRNLKLAKKFGFNTVKVESNRSFDNNNFFADYKIFEMIQIFSILD